MTSIIGAGGHAHVVLDALLANKFNDIQIYDNNKVGLKILGFVIEDINSIEIKNAIHVAIGDNKSRYKLINEYLHQSYNLKSVKHPQSIISFFSKIEPGAMISAGAVIGPNVIINHGTIINHNAVVDHECIIGMCSHIAPSATLGGNVQIGEGGFIGAGAVVLPGVKIGNWVTVGAGSVVTKDLPDNCVVKGVPAR
ncbi:MAG: acetyltransferase [Francisellaceae bacterium]|nr:acetyltransferase [Francisellaceae bacterium]